MTNYYQKAINAVYYANPAKLQQLIDEGHFYTCLLENTGLLTNPLPIWRIPQLWEASLGRAKDWNRDIRYLVADFLARIHEVKEILAKSFGVEYTPIDYQQYTWDFYAAKPNESIEEALCLDNIEEAYVNGARPIDVELYFAGVSFDFARAEMLLKEGADPNQPLDEYDNYLYDRIDGEGAFLQLNINTAWKYTFRPPVDDEKMADLVGSAAHEQMFDLIRKYSQTDNSSVAKTDKFVYGPDMNPDTAKLWWIRDYPYDKVLLVMDSSRAKVIEIGFGEKNFDNYTVCISAYVKDFKALYGVKTNKELAIRMHNQFYDFDSIDVFIEKVKGLKDFKVLDYRLTESSTELDKYIHKCAMARYHTLSQEYVVEWHRGVILHLREASLTDDEILHRFKKDPIPVLMIKNHCCSATYEFVAKTYLAPKE